jgi:SPP1 gp7 family putative phage head morphogenesis protein
MIQLRGGEIEGVVTEGRVMKIARTEVNRFQNSAKVTAYKESGLVKAKQWDSYLDERTSDICKRLNGQVVGLDEEFTDYVTGMKYEHPPGHCNCRSVLRSILK